MDALADFVTWEKSVSFAAGAGMMAALWFGTRVSNVLARRVESGLDSRLDAWGERRENKAKIREREAHQRSAAEELERLRAERVGRRFLFRAHRDDAGMVGEVIALSQRQSKTHVLIQWSSPPGRDPHEDDYSTTHPIGMEWKALTCSPDYYRHFTASFLLKSGRDADGWVQFEEIRD